MTVHALAAYHVHRGLSAEQILEEFPHLDLARIYTGLAYYYANKAPIEAYWAADEELYNRLAAKYPEGWTPENDKGM